MWCPPLVVRGCPPTNMILLESIVNSPTVVPVFCRSSSTSTVTFTRNNRQQPISQLNVNMLCSFSPLGKLAGRAIYFTDVFLARSAKLPEGLYILPMFFLYLFFLVVAPEPRWLRSQWSDLHQNFRIGRQLKGLDNTIELF